MMLRTRVTSVASDIPFSVAFRIAIPTVSILTAVRLHDGCLTAGQEVPATVELVLDPETAFRAKRSDHCALILPLGLNVRIL